MQNPLDTAGEIVKNSGEHGSQFLFGLARYIEALTGDATTAAIFTGFLLFTLTLVGKAGTSKNAELYSKALMGIAVLGSALMLVVSAWSGYRLTVKSGMTTPFPERLQYMAFTGRNWGEFSLGEFWYHTLSTIDRYGWFFAVFLVIFAVGLLVYAIHRISWKSAEKEPS